MKRNAVCAIFLLFSSYGAMAQSEEDLVKQAVNNLFVGMKNGDRTLAKTAFSEGCMVQTIVDKEGKITVQKEALAGFLNFIGTPHKEEFDKQIVFTKILIDGPLASVWTDYKFYIDGKLSHCGVNSFQLVKREQKWKIVYLI